MSDTQHTPGPWEITTERSSRSGQPWLFRQAEGGGCAQTIFDGDDIETWPLSGANAALIAAAPDLLAALERLIPWVGKMIADGGHEAAVAPLDCVNGLLQAEAAIAKTKTGGAS